MIEDKELGLKISESPDETYWTEQREQALKAVEIEKRNIIINETMIKLCEEQIKKLNKEKKNGK